MYADLQIISSSGRYADLFFEWRTQASTVEHNPMAPMSLDQCKERLENEESDLSQIWSGKDFRWFLKSDGEIVSNFSLKAINEMMLTAEIGYGVSERFQGKGVGTTTVKMLVDHIFFHTPLRKLVAFIHDQNIASIKILEKVGFKQEGLLREHYLINGNPSNEAVFGLLKSEWK